jgi:acetylornithine deacetylase/succinyl-diaminopimelate desuccinylase-like protein
MRFIRMAVPTDPHARLALLDRYVRIPTVSRTVTVDQVGAVRSFWRELGLALEPLLPASGTGTPALFGEVRGDRPGPTVLLYGHYDVQPPGNLDDWRWGGRPCDPWTLAYFGATGAPGAARAPGATGGDEPVEPDRLPAEALGGVLLVARGSCDNKGQHLGNILGVLAARQAGTLPGVVKIILDGEEEHGSPNLAAIAERHRDLLAADLLIGSDGPKLRGEPTVVLGCRGLLGVEVRVENNRGASVHSGNYGNVVANPVYPLARLLAGLPERIAAVGHRHTAFRDAALAAFGELPERASWEPFLQPTTNVNGLLSEGVDPRLTRTIIPAWALAKLDVRLTPDTPPDEVFAAIEEARLEETARSRGVTITVRRSEAVPPSYTPPERPEFAAIVNATRAYWGREPQMVPLVGGTLPNFVFTDLLGLPSYWLPGAQPDNRQHDVNEHYLLEHFLRQPAWYAAVLDAVAALA